MNSMHLAAIGIIATLASPSAQSVPPPPSLDTLQALVKYDAAKPLDVKESGVAERNGARIREIDYAKLDGGRNAATLIEPLKGQKFPAILFVHWYDPDEPDSNRTQFIPDAEKLAAQGVLSLAIDTMWTEPTWFNKRNPNYDRSTSIEQVKELRRALDVLLARPGVDPGRVAYVGHDFGAMYGVLAAAVDKRIKAFVFIAGTRSFSDWFLLNPKLEGPARQAVIRRLAVLDPVAYVGAIAPAPLLFQFAKTDPYVPKEAADALVSAAKEPKEARWYDAGHGLNADSRRDLGEWLAGKLVR